MSQERLKQRSRDAVASKEENDAGADREHRRKTSPHETPRSEGVTGTMAGKTFRAKAVNTGDASLKAADCTVDDAGNVFATPVPTGLLLMVR